MNKKQILLTIIGLSYAGLNNQLAARPQFPSFFDIEDQMEDMFKNMRRSMKKMRHQFSFGPSKEEREAVKTANENLAKIEPSVTKDKDNNVLIKFPLYNVDKKAITPVEINENVASGIIPTEFGKIVYYITPTHLEITKSIEIKKEEKPKAGKEKAKLTEDKKETAESSSTPAKTEEKTKTQEPEISRYSYIHYGSTNSMIHSLPLTVDIKSAEPETQFNKEKNVDELVIKLAPRSYLKKEIQHKS